MDRFSTRVVATSGIKPMAGIARATSGRGGGGRVATREPEQDDLGAVQRPSGGTSFSSSAMSGDSSTVTMDQTISRSMSW